MLSADPWPDNFRGTATLASSLSPTWPSFQYLRRLSAGGIFTGGNSSPLHQPQTHLYIPEVSSRAVYFQPSESRKHRGYRVECVVSRLRVLSALRPWCFSTPALPCRQLKHRSDKVIAGTTTVNLLLADTCYAFLNTLVQLDRCSRECNVYKLIILVENRNSVFATVASSTVAVARVVDIQYLEVRVRYPHRRSIIYGQYSRVVQ
jgi:hypothetical protein